MPLPLLHKCRKARAPKAPSARLRRALFAVERAEDKVTRGPPDGALLRMNHWGGGAGRKGARGAGVGVWGGPAWPPRPELPCSEAAEVLGGLGWDSPSVSSGWWVWLPGSPEPSAEPEPGGWPRCQRFV